MSERQHSTLKEFRVTAGSKSRPLSARLVVLDGPGRGRKFTIQQEAIIGRSAGNTVIIDDGEVSRRHARISVGETGGYVIEDLGSSNGTAVNGVPIRGPSPLAIGDKIQLAERIVLVVASYDPTEQELLQRQRLETLGRLAAGLAHDFNNMQAVITAGLDFVLGLDQELAVGTPRINDTLRDIVKASDRASELARSLMGYARSDSDGYHSIDVSYACEEVLRFVQRTFEKTIDVVSEIDPGLHVIGSGAELNQMLMNLCVNARDAMAEGGRLSVRVERIAGDAARDMELPVGAQLVLITIADTGVGMDDDTRSRVFEPFFTTKSARAGVGLGLATVKEIVMSHGGTLDVASLPDEGSTFRVCLPAASSPKRRRAISISAMPKMPKLPQGTLVLIADDHEMVRRTFERILAGVGCQVVMAHDGIEVVARYAAQARRPDLVILDLDMPGASGEDAITTLRDLDPHVRILVVSGHHEEARERTARALGAVGFLRKPFNAAVLTTAVLAALQDEVELEEEKTTLGKNRS
jgi:signal transduction histidine kinase/ActR/RegA family two-component response regulator